MARQPEAVIELHREVGAALTAYLEASPLAQGDLARLTNYHRTSVSHIQAGRQFPERGFWEKADQALGADGALVAHYDNACDQEVQLKRVELERQQSERRARAKATTGNSATFGSDVAPYGPGGQLYTDSTPIDTDYLESIHKEIKNFVHLDQQYGGVAASPVILRAYRQMRHRINTSEIRPGLHRDLYSALSEVAEVAGWSLYDGSDNDGLTERVNHESLSLACMAGDRSMELFVLHNMSMHAETIGRLHESLNTSQLVLETNHLSPRLEALFRLRLARSYSKLQADGEARKQLERARALFKEGVRDDDPHWSWWVDDAQLWWFEGAVRIDLGKKGESVEFFELSANTIPEPRMNFIYRAWALYGYALNGSWGNIDQLLRGLMGDVGIFRSRLAEIRIRSALDLIEQANAPSTVRDLASALRRKLVHAA